MPAVKITGVYEINGNKHWVTFEFKNDQKFIEGLVVFKGGKLIRVKTFGKGELQTSERMRIGLKAKKALENK